MVGDNLTLERFRAYCYYLPLGGISFPPILQYMCDAIHLQGMFVSLRNSCIGNPDCSWLLEYPVVNFPRQFKSFQSAVLHVLKRNHIAEDLSATLHRKVLTTLRWGGSPRGRSDPE